MATKQRAPVPLHVERRRRRDSAAAIQRLFPDLAGVSRRLRSAVSRARCGRADPLYRVVDFLAEARAAGASREQAMAVAVHVLAVIEELWGDERIDAKAALLAEQAPDGHEDVLQLRAMDNPALRATWAREAEAYLVTLLTAIGAVRRADVQRAA